MTRKKFRYEVEYSYYPYSKPSKMIKRAFILATSKKDAMEWVKSIKKGRYRGLHGVEIKKLKKVI